jgi:hypothetical protein
MPATSAVHGACIDCQEAIAWQVDVATSVSSLLLHIANSFGLMQRSMCNRMMYVIEHSAHQGVTLFDPIQSGLEWTIIQLHTPVASHQLFQGWQNVQLQGLQKAIIFHQPFEKTIQLLLCLQDFCCLVASVVMHQVSNYCLASALRGDCGSHALGDTQ